MYLFISGQFKLFNSMFQRLKMRFDGGCKYLSDNKQYKETCLLCKWFFPSNGNKQNFRGFVSFLAGNFANSSILSVNRTLKLTKKEDYLWEIKSALPSLVLTESLGCLSKDHFSK